MVFVVLLAIIVLTELISKLAGKEEVQEEPQTTFTSTKAALPLNINDEDALVACLVASIDYPKETTTTPHYRVPLPPKKKPPISE